MVELCPAMEYRRPGLHQGVAEEAHRLYRQHRRPARAGSLARVYAALREGASRLNTSACCKNSSSRRPKKLLALIREEEHSGGAVLMADPRGFLKVSNASKTATARSSERVQDFDEVEAQLPEDHAPASRRRAVWTAACRSVIGRCPVGSLIPEWQDKLHQRRLERRLRHSAKNEQLPGIHRAVVSRAVRAGRACWASTTTR